MISASRIDLVPIEFHCNWCGKKGDFKCYPFYSMKLSVCEECVVKVLDSVLGPHTSEQTVKEDGN